VKGPANRDSARAYQHAYDVLIFGGVAGRRKEIAPAPGTLKKEIGT